MLNSECFAIDAAAPDEPCVQEPCAVLFECLAEPHSSPYAGGNDSIVGSAIQTQLENFVYQCTGPAAGLLRANVK